MVREIERGLNPERVNALEEDLKTPRDVLEELVKSLGITVQRKSRRLSQPANSSFHNASNMKVHNTGTRTTGSCWWYNVLATPAQQ